jgi:CHASE3 domain sensor protein
MGIRAKMLLGFLILATMLLLAGAWSIYEVTSIGASVQGLLDENYKSVDAARQMIEALEREDSAVLLLLSGKWSEGRAIIEAADTSFRAVFQLAESNVTLPDEQAYIDQIEEAYGAYKDIWIRPIVGTDREQNLDWYLTRVHQSFLDARSPVQELRNLNDRAMYQTASGLQQRARRAVMPGVVAIVAALVFSLLFNYFIDSFLVKPIIDITQELQSHVNHHTPFRVEISTHDELGDLAMALRQVLARPRSGGVD